MALSKISEDIRRFNDKAVISEVRLVDIKLVSNAEILPVSIASLPLPAGASTETTSAALLTELELKADLAETQPVDIIASLPSGTNYVGRVRLTDALTDVKYPANTFAVNGASVLTVLAAVSNIKHRIFHILITTDTTGTLTISDGFGAVYSIVTNGPIILDFGVVGRLQDTANTIITITNSGGGNVSAHGTYSIVAA